jgi:hypothetical protein
MPASKKQKKSMLDPLYSANTPKVSKKAAKQIANAIIKSSTKKSK